LVPGNQNFLFVFGTRSSKLDEITTALAGRSDFKIAEHVVPPLNDTDIDGLIGVLETNNRLGILTGASSMARRAAFRDQAGRQLLVAMIQATSGEKFEKKAQDEYLELTGTQRYAYALIAMGFTDLVIEADLKRWDIAAIIPIIEGAGGIVTDWSGGTAGAGGNVIASGDARIHAEALAILNAG